jgi:hypothetical protein
VIDAINQMKDYDAGGILPAVDWTTAHLEMPDCFSMVKIVDGKFKPAFGERGKPFLCFPKSLTKIPAKPELVGVAVATAVHEPH